ncbi:MAG: peptidase MA family metallohydrolase [candidate division KSB1 bacterium]|nr:peptidase MA family metallohydrolase [candidate division KSB1 bacterium]MDZ7345806.1 peptidase MA family metallohydrolase [candidate division KSB1 bacterium]
MKRLFLTILVLLTTLFAVEPEYESYLSGRILIYSTTEDAPYRPNISRIIRKAIEEITFDFDCFSEDTLVVYIAPSRRAFREMTNGTLPSWVGAFAVPNSRAMIIKSPRWSQDLSFETTIVHELTHLILHDCLEGAEIPRWLDEGLAIFYSKEERRKTSTVLSKAIASNSLIPLDQIEWVLEYGRIKADLAYQESYSATLYFLQTYDIDGLRQLLGGLRRRLPLDECFILATGSSFRQFEAEWRAYISTHEKYVWLYELEDYFWVGVIFLAVAAFIAKWIRKRRIEREWEEESVQSGTTETADGDREGLVVNDDEIE